MFVARGLLGSILDRLGCLFTFAYPKLRKSHFFSFDVILEWSSNDP